LVFLRISPKNPFASQIVATRRVKMAEMSFDALRGCVTVQRLMSARKLEGLGVSPNQQHVTVEARQTRLTLSPAAVTIHKGGIEFRSQTAFPRWVEMTVTLQSPHDGAKVNCSGVVVECSGSKHAGYHVAMVFTGLSKQATARLNAMAFASLG
jgi:hypothetical protein